MWPRQYQQTIDPFAGLAQSVVTGNPLFFGDAAMVVFSLVTSSGTASRWTWLGCDPTDNLNVVALPPVDANNWNPVKIATQAGYWSFDTLPKWGALQRTPSASSTTITVTIYVGP